MTSDGMNHAKNRIKIAFISTPIEFGGSDKVNLTLLKNIDRNKFHITAVPLIRPWEKGNFFIQELKEENYEIHEVPVAIRTASEGTDYFRVIRCYKTIYSILKKGSFDLIHTHGYFADIVGIPAARMLQIPNISTCHGFISNNWKYKLYNKLDCLTLRFSNKIIAVSDEIRNDLIKKGIKESSIEIIRNAVRVNYDHDLIDHNRQKKRQLFNLYDGELVVGYAGRLSAEKGIEYLIRAASMLINMEVPIKVLILGEGPQRSELEDLVEKMNIRDKVTFAGFQEHIEGWLPALDIFVLPSLTEGTPMSLLEAMACGLPVVASAVGGIPQVIESGKNGMLVSPAKPEEIKNAIQQLYKNKDMRLAVSEAARETIRLNYNVEDWTSKIEAEYLKIKKKIN
jgi:glycosyltransferase involved in cell wall biosynthesis